MEQVVLESGFRTTISDWANGPSKYFPTHPVFWSCIAILYQMHDEKDMEFFDV